MSKKILPRLIVGLSFLAAAVLFLLSELMPDQFGGFNLAWAGLIFSGASGLALLLSALFTKNSVALKKLQILLSAILLVAVLCLVSALALPKNLVLPIILVVAAALLVLSILFTGGKKWDEGDNHKVGYKNYYQRKAEEEKNKSDDQQ